MPLLPDAAAFAAALPDGRLLCVDVGSKTLGLAVSDETRALASPLKTLRRRKWATDKQDLFDAMEGRVAVGWVVGLPIGLDGAAGPSAQAARAFARNLLAERDLPLLMWDERLSTAEAERAMIAADVSRRKRAEGIDAAAAAVILQSALDAIRP